MTKPCPPPMKRLAEALRSALDWLFRDRATGRYVIWQFPNIALLVFLAARVLEWLIGGDGALAVALQWLGTAAILWWAGDEVLRGVNPFRRILGAVVLVAVGGGLLRQLQ